MLWAIGQEQNAQGRYNHNPRSISALETNNVVITDFYRQDELKYHGYTGQRGAATLNFYRELSFFVFSPRSSAKLKMDLELCAFTNLNPEIGRVVHL